jgi:hypothetical protein
VRITLKKAYTDGTIAVEMDPLSLHAPRGRCDGALAGAAAKRT